MSKQKSDTDIEAIVDAAREEFDLDSELYGRSQRTRTVRVFTDEVTGERLGGVELRQTTDTLGFPKQEVHSWGLAAEVLKLSATEEDEKKNAKAIKALKDEEAVLLKKLAESALDIEVHSIPKLVKDDAHRAARAALGIKEKVTTSHPRYDEYIDEADAQLLQRCTLSVTKVPTKQVNKALSIKSARNLRAHLPEWEWAKINLALNELLYEKVIASAAVENTDF